MFLDNVLFNVIDGKMLLCIGHGNPRMRDPVKFITGQVRLIMIAPVIKEKIMQKGAARRRAVIQFEIFAYTIGKIGDVVNMGVDA
ncbi:MAG: hypothetical protein BWX99_02518 [Deltaproteobacteria bacterium ADurb.Bin151]|nr:MAG: hypothetical protein BWX99_02518 [Deltaproteobacteria bacterium ADurb.Bin151]